MNSKDYIEQIKKFFVMLVVEVKINNAFGHYDINSVAENFYIPILKYIYGCIDLENQNKIQYNFPAIDLGCKTTKTSFQVTSSADSKKIIYTIEKFKEHDLHKEYDTLYVLIITEKQKNYTSARLLEVAKEIEFNVKNNIIDYSDLIELISSKDVGFLKGLADLLRKEFEKHTKFALCRDVLNKFLDLSSSRVRIEKDSKKYIPDVFVESNQAKDKARLFANPAFFYRKIFDTLNSINYTWINEYLFKLGLDPIESHLPAITVNSEISKLNDIQNHLKELKNDIEKEIVKIRPYHGGYKEASTDFEVPAGKESYKSILKVKLRYSSYGLLNKYDDALSKIDLCLSRVLLITSMAGQGKTNFVCDFVDNFCARFEVPVILIPARELNGVVDHSIFSYITNNKYLKDINDKFELFNFFDDVAKKIDKPFLVIIDGINEIKDLELFNNVLSDFIEVGSQYHFVKFILTCRSEFFEKKYASLMSKPFSGNIHHLKDIKSEMSDFHLDQAIECYFKFFNIRALLSEKAKKFLKNDLLLLRIYCEYNQNKNLGQVEDIFKDQLYEDYLISIIDRFDPSLKNLALPTLYKLVEKMLESNDYASLPVNGYNKDESDIIKRLVYEDVLLRRELPVKDLQSIGIEAVSFIYDELRDFLIAHYLVNKLSITNMPAFVRKFDETSKYQVYEGVSKYTYILSRKNNNEHVISHIEGRDDFEYLYTITLYSFPPEYQIESDLTTSKRILSKESPDISTLNIAIYLHSRESADEILNISLLLEHINSLDDESLVKFVTHIFEGRYTTVNRRQKLNKFIQESMDYSHNNIDNIDDNTYTFLLQVSTLADYELQYEMLMACIRVKEAGKKLGCFEYLEQATSNILREFTSKIQTRSENVQD